MIWEMDAKGAKRVAAIAELVKKPTKLFSRPIRIARARPFPGICSTY